MGRRADGEAAVRRIVSDQNIERLRLQNLNAPIMQFTHRLHEDGEPGGYILDPPYQRASVWLPHQRVNLIKSLLQGLPCGAVFVNDRGDYRYRVVDGKQRIETIRGFADGEFSVPAVWFDPRFVKGGRDNVFWEDIHESAHRWFEMTPIAVYVSKLRTEDEERDLYERINYGGTPHPPKER